MNPKPKLTILVGTPGSGKSSFAKDVIYAKQNNNENYPEIVCQDELGNRQRCIETMNACLRTGYDVIIDRTNINKKQRSYFIKEALKFTDNIHCVEFITDNKECIKRILNRKGHKTIKDNTSEQKIKEIIKRFEDSYEKPTMDENFQSITTIYVDNGNRSTKSDSLRDRFRSFINTPRTFITRLFTS